MRQTARRGELAAEQLAAAALRARLHRLPHASLRMRGGSMRPLLRDGWRVRVRAASPRDLRRGAVVAVDAVGIVVVHAVVDRRGDLVTTRGLARVQSDAPVRTSQVLGVVDAIGGPAGPWLPLGPRGVAAIARLGFLLRALWCRARRA